MIPISSQKSPRVRGFRAVACAALPVLLAMLLAAGTATANFTVTNTADSGAGSLRQALADAAAAAGADTVDFAAGLSGQTVTLTSGTLATADTDGVTVDASALAGGLTITATGGFRAITNTGILTLRGLKFTGIAISDDNGAAVFSSGQLTLDLCTFSGNSADAGGAVSNNGIATLTHCIFTGNSAVFGGALRSSNSSGAGSLSLDGCTFSGNSVGDGAGNGAGGAIYDLTTPTTIRRCIFSGNTSENFGGGFYCVATNASAMLLDSTFVGNSTAGNRGGAVYGNSSTSQTISATNCTFTGNSVTGPSSSIAKGGAIYSTGPAIVLTHCTVVNNHASFAPGGVGATVTTVTVSNCIVANNGDDSGASDVYAPAGTTLTGQNIIGAVPPISTTPANIYYVPIDPHLAPLGYYGGPTPTMPPLPGSPAIDHAVGSTTATDQRGLPRPVSYLPGGSAVADIGAAEAAVSASDIAPSTLTYSANPAVYTRTALIPANVPSLFSGGGLTYTVAPALPAGLALNPGTGFIGGTPTAAAAATDYTITTTNIGGATSAIVNITVNDIPPYTQAQYDANFTAGQTSVINNPNSFSLYTLSQVQALNVGTPLLTKDAGTGQFKLTIGVKKTASLNQPFTDFPLSAPGTSINAQGKLEFLFTVPGNAAFFRLESQ